MQRNATKKKWNKPKVRVKKIKDTLGSALTCSKVGGGCPPDRRDS